MFVGIAASFPVTELVQTPSPSYDDNYRKSLSRGTVNESKILPLGRGCSSKGHREGRGRGLGKKTRDKKQTFPLFTKERFVRGPGLGGGEEGWEEGMFNFSHANPGCDARRHSCHAWNSRHNGVCSRLLRGRTFASFLHCIYPMSESMRGLISMVEQLHFVPNKGERICLNFCFVQGPFNPCSREWKRIFLLLEWQNLIKRVLLERNNND